MIVIPAIDLQGGRCVRLRQGDFDQATVYGEDPLAVAETWRRGGAQRLHVVDLDGSREGRPCNGEVIRRLAANQAVPLEVGGGIRDMETVEGYLQAGVQWVILGTAALRDGAFVREACRRFPGRILLGIDARKGRVAIEGWTAQTDVTAADVARRFASAGLAAVIYTDIQRDGMETGVNVEATAQLARQASVPVIASGGVSCRSDIEALRAVEKDGVLGVVVGRALYTGALSLAEAIEAAGDPA